jgi:hypothetical protein
LNHRSLLVLMFLVGLACSPGALGVTPADTQTEVSYLLGMVEMSGCQFYRNGTWHDSKKAQEHLRSKYDYLASHGRIGTTEDFIEKAATQSSLSGRVYQVRCSGGETMTSNQWLRDALTRYRSVKRR